MRENPQSTPEPIPDGDAESAVELEPSPPPGQPAELDMAYARTVIRRLGPVGPLALIAASFPALGGFVLLGSMKWSGAWLQAQGDAGPAIYGVGFAVMAGLALLPTYAQAVVGGWAFGLTSGTIAALGGIAGASLIGYVIARRASGDRVVQLIGEQPKWQAVYEALAGGGFWKTLGIVTLLRIPPNSPFAITNLVMAAARIHPLVYILGTIVGIAPRTAAAVFIGAQLSDLDFSNARQSWFVISGLFALVIVVAIIGTLAKRAIARVTTDIPEKQ